MTEKVEIKEDFIHLMSITLNYLEEKDRLIILYSMGNLSKKEIADILGISKSYVCRIFKKAVSKLRYFISHEMSYYKVFSVDAIGDKYVISFSIKDISEFNNSSKKFLEDMEVAGELSEFFKVNCNNERISIQIFAEPESFVLIAKFLQKIYDQIDVKLTSVETNTDVKKDHILKPKKVTKAEQIRDYMLSMECFSVQELKKHFPNFTVNYIKDSVKTANKKGLIKRVARGKYVVNKVNKN